MAALVLLVLVGCAVAMGTTGADAATSATVVSATIPSATSLDASACARGTPATDLGLVLPGQTVVSSADCAVQFGSSNDSSQLRAFQTDGAGVAMYRRNLGVIDTTWGTAGYLTRNDGGFTYQDPEVAVDGSSFYYSTYTGGVGWRLLKFTAAGTMDPSFNGGAPLTVATAAALPPVSGDEWISVTIAPDRTVTVIGVYNPGSSSALFVRRYLPSGAVDPSFNGGAFRMLSNTVDERIPQAVVRPDGRIVISADSQGVSTVYQLRADGTLDTSWAGDGAAEVTVPTTSTTVLENLALDSAGRVVTVGKANFASEYRIAAARLLTDGTLDPSFASGGTTGIDATIAVTGNSSSRDVAIQADGRIAIAGYANLATQDFAIVRLDATGAPDPTFSGDGIQTLDVAAGPGDNLQELMLLGEGGMIVGGEAAAAQDGVIARFNADGSLDTTFGTNGLILTSSSLTSTTGMGQLPDGTFVATGRTVANTQSVMRFSTATVPNFAAGTTDFTSNAFGACLHTLSGGGVGGAGAGAWTAAGSGNCTAALPGNWRPVVATNLTSGTKVAAAPLATPAAVANLRFAFRAASSQQPGAYVAPITFEVVAPDS